MALLFSGDDAFEQSGPPQWRQSTWELDQLIVPWRGGINNLNTFLGDHPINEPSAIDDSMFLSQTVIDNHKQFPTVELVYLGRKGGVLPPQKHDYEEAVQSASSVKGATGGPLAAPVTAQFYAPSNILTYISRGGQGTATASEPPGTPRLITLTIYDSAYTPGSTNVDFIMNNFFSIQTLATFKSTEIVPGQYWLNVSRRIKSYTAIIFDVPSGTVVVSPSNGGQDYELGDVLTVSGGGGTGTVTVTSIINTAIPGQILAVTSSGGWTTDASNIPGVGGRGHGATFNIWVIP